MLKLSTSEKWLLGLCYFPTLFGLLFGAQALFSASLARGIELVGQAVIPTIALGVGVAFLARPSDLTLALAAVFSFVSLLGTLLWRAEMAEELLSAGTPRGAGMGTALLVISALLFLIGAIRVLLRALRAS